MTDQHNPRAFPSSAIDDRFGGMGLWDWYAGQALAAMTIKDDGSYSQHDHDEGIPEAQAGWQASAAARAADTMLAERAKRFDPDAATGCADDDLPGFAEQWPDATGSKALSSHCGAFEMRLTPEQQRKADGDVRERNQVEQDRRASSLARMLRKAKPRKARP